MMMRKSCSFDLHLYTSNSTLMGECTTKANKQEAILNNGRKRVFDLTELQARAIIWKASEEIMKKSVERECNNEVYASPAVATGSLKRSLRIFLQKRNKRLQSTSPYKSN